MHHLNVLLDLKSTLLYWSVKFEDVKGHVFKSLPGDRNLIKTHHDWRD